MFVHWNYQARRAAAISFFLTHSVLESQDAAIAFSISAYSIGESRVEINLPRFFLYGSAGLPTGLGSLMAYTPWFRWLHLIAGDKWAFLYDSCNAYKQGH
jgi:hypothetical protein